MDETLVDADGHRRPGDPADPADLGRAALAPAQGRAAAGRTERATRDDYAEEEKMRREGTDDL